VAVNGSIFLFIDLILFIESDKSIAVNKCIIVLAFNCFKMFCDALFAKKINKLFCT